MTMTEQYRVDEYGKIYEYSEEHRAFLFAGSKLPGETDEDAIERVDRDNE